MFTPVSSVGAPAGKMSAKANVDASMVPRAD